MATTGHGRRWRHDNIIIHHFDDRRFFGDFTLNIQNSNNQTTTTTWQAFSYLFNEFLHFYFESGKEVGGGDIPWTLMAVLSMTDDVVVCVLSAVCCCRCLAFSWSNQLFSPPSPSEESRAAIGLHILNVYDLHPNNDCSSSSFLFHFVFFYFYLTEEVWSLGIVSPGPCRSLFIPGSIDICELRV